MGSRYTKEENAILKKFVDDHKDMKATDMVQMLKSYGLFPERGDVALGMQISRIKNPPKEDNNFDSLEQMTFDIDPVTAIMESDYRKLSEKYEGLITAVLTKAKPWRNEIGRIAGMTFDFKAIRDWLYENEPKRVNAWLEDNEER